MIDTNHQHRIDYEILVDCYDEYEQAIGWTIYLLENIECPFQAQYIGELELPVYPNEYFTVLCITNSEHDDLEDLEYFEAWVEIDVGHNVYEIPLADLKTIDASDKTVQAVEDWKYYINN